MDLSVLSALIRNGHGVNVVKYIKENTNFNIHEIWNGDTALHHLCEGRFGKENIMKALLAHTEVNVNAKNTLGSTPLTLACANSGMLGCIKLLLKDPRVEVNMANNYGNTPLWTLIWNAGWTLTEYLEEIKWLVALRGDELDLEKKGFGYGKECSPLELARIGKKCLPFIERLVADPKQVRYEVCLEFNFPEALTADLFAMTVLLCDDFLRLNETASSASRFFNIAKQLPIELQMIVCHRAHGSGKDNIKSKVFEPAFKHIVKEMSLSEIK